MFSVGFFEMVVIVGVALVCFRPHDYQRFFFRLGQYIQKLNAFWSNPSAFVNTNINPPKDDTKENP